MARHKKQKAFYHRRDEKTWDGMANMMPYVPNKSNDNYVLVTTQKK